MRYEKRGLSTVVTTLIIILLVLAAIGIIWVVIRNVVEQGSGQVQTGADCINIRLQIDENSVTSNGVNVQRVGGGGVVGGIKASMTDGANACSGSETGDTVDVLDTVAITWEDGCSASGVVTVTASAYLEDDTTICDPSDEIEARI